MLNADVFLSKMLPGQDFTDEIGFKLTLDNWMLPGVCGAPEPQNQSVFISESGTAIASSSGSAPSNALSVANAGGPTPMTPLPDDEHSSDDDARVRVLKLQALRDFSRPKPSLLPSYLGRSSATDLFVKAFEMRTQLGPGPPRGDMFHYRPWVSILGFALPHQTKHTRPPQWLTFFDSVEQPSALQFPDKDLMDELVEHYFTNINIFTPVLHRPTFGDNLKSDLHHRERNFGCVVLLVCALGSRFSQDRRVLVDGDQTWHSSGWKWFIQTRIFDDARLLSTSWNLHVLQAACVRLQEVLP